MALGVDGMRAGRVVLKATLLTLGTLGFTFCLTLMYLAMRSVMDVGGSCASGGPYAISTPCPQGVGWVMPVAIFGALLSVGICFLGVFSEGGPRPYAFAWSALFLALGWNFLDYGFNPPGGGTSASWLVCGVIFVLMGGLPLVLLLSKSARRWALWGRAPETPVRAIRRAQPAPARTPTFMPAAGGGLVPPRPPVSEAPATPGPATILDAAPSSDMVARLEQLADLHERGALDDREYEIAKNAILHDEVEP
jgi:hypothetical protein